MFKRVWSNIFGISAGEYSGFKLLIFTALICWLGLALANHLSKSPYSNYEEDAKLLDSLLLVMQKNQVNETRPERTIILSAFDPNTVSKDNLMKIGFPKWLANRLVNYRLAGARFTTPEDLLKLYDFPESLYLQVVDYVVIEPEDKPKVLHGKRIKSSNLKFARNPESTPPTFDLNTADTAVFQTIKGIGSKLSNRIVNYRNLLGGFVAKSQLYQVYRLDSGVVEKLLSTSVIASDFIPLKIGINNFNKEQLANHPYINWNKAKLIVAYRNQHGSFSARQELLKVYSINEDWLKKIAPYLTF